jgi:DNA-binding MarR family transcriptional regulator
MNRSTDEVKVQNTRDLDALVAAMIDLMGFLASPRRDDALLREAGVTLDRALFPLLVRLGGGALAVAELADQVGRDHTTISRQLAKLESLGLVERCESPTDRRVRAARLTEAGARVGRSIAAARNRLLSHALADWPPADLTALSHLTRRFADSLTGYPSPSGEGVAPKARRVGKSGERHQRGG